MQSEFKTPLEKRHYVIDGDRSRAFSVELMQWVDKWDEATEWPMSTEADLWDKLQRNKLVSTTLLKADIWRRATDAEAEVIDAAIAAAPVRLRRLFNDSAFLDTHSPDFALIRAPMAAAFGSARADELLAPSE